MPPRDHSDPQQDVETRLRQVRDEIDSLLDGEHPDLEAGEICGVVVGYADGDQALVRATQEPRDREVAPLASILGEFLDGLAQANGTPMETIAMHAVQVMRRSKRTEQYEQRAETWREETADAKQRFENEGVTEEDVDDAIDAARSEDGGSD